eukprot:gnl/Trimastix_PCT/3490.p2 GENE.gnl/Trimastix_PCT/3490~~gnl/Trimastix_PCT/3490.p2  ORF type:complete len:144 (+),score=29.86 gnl/Trimastix_PCT/3490:110-541(+)
MSLNDNRTLLETGLWILGSGILMSCVGLIGALLLFLKASWRKKVEKIMVAFAAGTLMSGALFHMLPHTVDKLGNTMTPYTLFVGGILSFLLLEQFIHNQLLRRELRARRAATCECECHEAFHAMLPHEHARAEGGVRSSRAPR